ncbi:MAG: hypothetical protein FWC37_09395, partial [Lentimicrobiaceae bacterium]|nr:hypothetical protein [Lentimicrobiaceae bacterium]
MLLKRVIMVALPSFQSRVHSVHTILKTARKKMSANPRASILYSKKYNMRYPIFASILLLLPTHAQDNAGGFVQKSKTSLLPEGKPHAQKLLTQFLRHLPTHPEIEVNRRIISKMTKSDILKDSSEKKKGGMAWHCLQRAVWHNGGCASLDSITKQQVTW